MGIRLWVTPTGRAHPLYSFPPAWDGGHLPIRLPHKKEKDRHLWAGQGVKAGRCVLTKDLEKKCAAALFLALHSCLDVMGGGASLDSGSLNTTSGPH